MTDLELCQLCADAYERPNVVAGPFAALVVCDPEKGTVAVAHRGTWNPLGWANNARFLMTPYWAGMVHRGFADAWLALQCGIWQEMVPSGRLRPDDPRMAYYVTGHSLGGAQALVSLKAFNPGTPTRVVTFGCPRVGNAAFCRGLRDKLGGLPSVVDAAMTRYVMPGDFVPHLPPLLLRDWLGALAAGTLKPFGDLCYRHPCAATRLGGWWDAVTGWVRGALNAAKAAKLAQEKLGMTLEGLGRLGALTRAWDGLPAVLDALIAPHRIETYLDAMRRRGEVGAGL